MAQLIDGLRRRFSRKDPGETPPGGTPVDLAQYPGVIDLYVAGDFAAARQLLTATEPHLSDAEIARIDLQLRHEAYLTLHGTTEPDATWPPQPTSADSPTDVPADQLTAELLINGVRQHGYLIVRGLLDTQTCATLRSMTDQAFLAKHDPGQADPAWYTPLCDTGGNILDPVWRHNTTNWADSALPVPDSPLAAREVLAAFDDAGIPGVVRDYLGVAPMLTLEKWNLRRVPPTAGTSWHQDGAFMGTHLHTVNLWVTLSDCGQDAPGLDIVDKRFDHIVETGTPGAYYDWDVSPDIVEVERGEAQIMSPSLKAGDAVFFDHYLLHRTGVNPGMTQTRYALECWFFTPWSKPERYEGMLV